ncbi:MAG: exodeoxyribonuclease III [Bacteroidetes bacterium]|uniref:Exodeoxyribonuclease III n=1 Tax=Candidatus Pullibacteroides excrementavium TaxID=2840905 RepID=A0A9D9DVE6_9BACT|nr:exodeoxyribonuclease III [Candidatus Pullibacteroides excrementavium]
MGENRINRNVSTKRIITYNLNGIRSAASKGFIEWLRDCGADIVCLQETKAQPDQIPVLELAEAGYTTYCLSAQKKGYSGVALLCRQEPDHVEKGMGITAYDNEGRFIRADFGKLSVVSVYHPSGTSGEERQAFKMQWLADFQNYVEDLRKTRPYLVLAGDYNICHEAIDIHDPVRNATHSGFLPEEREWMSRFLAHGYTDSFRFMHPGLKDQYTWWSFRAGSRAKNLGWRIDYLMLTDNLTPHLKDAFILPGVVHSDHCPSGIDIDF